MSLTNLTYTWLYASVTTDGLLYIPTLKLVPPEAVTTMPELLSQLNESQWANDGPQTPAQRHFAKYKETVDSYGFMEGSGSEFYAKDVLFHNQNNAEYHGSEQMWAWMKRLFGQFGRMRHDILNVWEITQSDGSTLLSVQVVRNIWIPGNKTDKPEVSAPMFWLSSIVTTEDEEAITGLQFKEVWLYWDTALLAPFLPKDAIAFRTKNVVEEGFN